MSSGETFGAGTAATPFLPGAVCATSPLTKLKRASIVDVLIHAGPPSQPLTLGGFSGSWPMRASW